MVLIKKRDSSFIFVGPFLICENINSFSLLRLNKSENKTRLSVSCHYCCVLPYKVFSGLFLG